MTSRGENVHYNQKHDRHSAAAAGKETFVSHDSVFIKFVYAEFENSTANKTFYLYTATLIEHCCLLIRPNIFVFRCVCLFWASVETWQGSDLAATGALQNPCK